VERTRLLVHLIDTSEATDEDPIHSYEVISGELGAFSESLAEKPVIVVATKLDATTTARGWRRCATFAASTDWNFMRFLRLREKAWREL